MKHLYILLIALFVFSGAGAQIVNIPDPGLKEILIELGVDTNHDNQIQQTEANVVTSLDVTNSTNIYSLQGISSFVNLQHLTATFNAVQSVDLTALTQLITLKLYSTNLQNINISGLTHLTTLICSLGNLTTLNLNGLTSLVSADVSGNDITQLDLTGCVNLKTLNCSGNQLASLDLTPFSNLNTVDCYTNALTTINVSGLNQLITLDCSHNALTALDVSNLSSLFKFSCDYNQLSELYLTGANSISALSTMNNQLVSLDLTGLNNLTSLYCNENHISALELSGFTALKALNCDHNELTELDLSSLLQLASLRCIGNHLTALDVSNKAYLTSVMCSENQISNLNTNGATALTQLLCGNNFLTSIDATGLTKLTSLDCSFNNLTTLLLKNGSFENPVFNGNPGLHYICCDENEVSTIQSKLASYGYTNSCNLNSYCTFTPGGIFYTISGSEKYDEGANGCDATDSIFPNLRFTIASGTVNGGFIADNTGNYTIPVQAATHTITPVLENPTYFTVSPTSASITFPTATSPFIQNFCIAPNGTHNDLEITLIPLSVARPGFDAVYRIVIKNKGTHTQSGTASLAFNDDVLDLVSAYPAVSSQATGSLTWAFTDLHPFESRQIDLTFNANSPTETPALNNGDNLSFTAAVNAGTDDTPSDNIAAVNQKVVNSLDPNDKTCLEGTTVTPAVVGKYVHYTIRFENNGTANAQNIVIKDVLDPTKFDLASLVPVSGSHAFFTRISNTTQVEFIFENINLPFDDASNDGYVTFKVKTKANLATGSSFSNKASIYFDYNFPIVTNTATTNIVALGTPDFDFGKFISIAPNPVKDVLHFDLKNISLDSVSIYNMLGQLVMADTNPGQGTDVSGLGTGTYFVRVYTDKGTATAQFVKQ